MLLLETKNEEKRETIILWAINYNLDSLLYLQTNCLLCLGGSSNSKSSGKVQLVEHWKSYCFSCIEFAVLPAQAARNLQTELSKLGPKAF